MRGSTIFCFVVLSLLSIVCVFSEANAKKARKHDDNKLQFHEDGDRHKHKHKVRIFRKLRNRLVTLVTNPYFTQKYPIKLLYNFVDQEKVGGKKITFWGTDQNFLRLR